MKIIVILTCVFAFLVSPTFAATYYMANSPANKLGWGNGSDTNNGTSKSAPFLTWAKARSAMIGGDTLVICDGTYTGASNMFDWDKGGGIPRSGSDGAWTIVKAETDGAVTIDGQGVREPVKLYGNTTVDNLASTASWTCRYIEFRGIVVANSPYDNWNIRNTDHIKLINCGSIDAGSGSTGINFYYSQYGLIEGCYAFGTGRYKFSTFHADHVIFRNCVSRFDAALNVANPVGDYAIYSSKYCEVQNCIAIDGDQPGKVTNVEVYGGAFLTPTTSGSGDGDNRPNYFTNVISLNNSTRFALSAANAYVSDMRFNNVVGWNHIMRNDDSFLHSQGSMNINHATFGVVSVATPPVYAAMFNGWANSLGNNQTLANSIFTGFAGALFYDIESATYLNLFGNTGNVTTSGPAPANIINTNPVYNVTSNPTGSLKYLPRIETGSSLAAAGVDGTYVGANIIKQYGKTGSLWGDPGYNLLQDGTNGQPDVNLWPFPNEDLIKAKMAAYTANGINGARGFASPGKRLDGVNPITLTSYIWEYLGNQMPSNIYGMTTSVPSIPKNVTVVPPATK
jgi:hypothetical protein